MKKPDLNRIKEMLDGMNRYDWTILLLIVTSLAFYDIKPVFLGMQAIAFVVTGLHLIARPKVSAHVLLFGLWMAVFCMYSLLSCLWASEENTTAFRTTLSIVQVGLIALCILVYCRKRKKLDRVINAVFVAAAILCIRFIIDIPFDQWGTGGRFSKETIFGSNTPALVLSYAAVLCLWRCFFPKKKHPFWGIAYLLMAAVFVIIPLLMGTKNSILIVGVGVAVMLIGRARNKKDLLRATIVMTGLTVVAFLAVMYIPFFYSAVGYRFERMIHGLLTGEGNSSTVVRVKYLLDSMNVFLHNPIFGIGQDGYRYVNITTFTYSHCNYSELLANLGIVGFGLYYSIYCWILPRAIRLRKKNMLPLILAAVGLILDITLVSYAYETSYVLLAITLGMLGNNTKGKSRVSKIIGAIVPPEEKQKADLDGGAPSKTEE